MLIVISAYIFSNAIMKHRIISLILLISALILIVAKADWWSVVLLAAIWLVITFLGVVNMDFHYFTKSYISNNSQQEKKIALTFDDGPTEFTPEFLKLLEQFNQKATFFCIGKQIEKLPEILNQIIENGHEIGNHSYSHSNLTGFFSFRKMEKDIIDFDAVLMEMAQKKTDLYRPPFGITNPNIAKAIKSTGKKTIGWNIRSFDTAISDEQKILNRLTPNIKPGSIILLHDTSQKSLNVLEQILLFLQHENYKSVTVSELFDFKSI